MTDFLHTLIAERKRVASRGHMPRRLELLDQLIEHYRLATGASHLGVSFQDELRRAERGLEISRRMIEWHKRKRAND